MLTLTTALGALVGTASAAPSASPTASSHTRGGQGASEAAQRPAGAWAGPLASGRPLSKEYGVSGTWSAGHHTGVDFAVPGGTPVRSVGSGTVVFAGTSGDYGKAVTIRMRDGRYTLFAHLSETGVERGTAVTAGTTIGKSGNTGRSTGPHLHFEVREKRGYGTDIDPVSYLAERGVRIG